MIFAKNITCSLIFTQTWHNSFHFFGFVCMRLLALFLLIGHVFEVLYWMDGHGRIKVSISVWKKDKKWYKRCAIPDHRKEPLESIPHKNKFVIFTCTKRVHFLGQFSVVNTYIVRTKRVSSRTKQFKMCVYRRRTMRIWLTRNKSVTLKSCMHTRHYCYKITLFNSVRYGSDLCSETN